MPISKVKMKKVYHLNLSFKTCTHHFFQLPLGKISHIYETFYLFLFCIGSYTLSITLRSVNFLQAHYPM